MPKLVYLHDPAGALGRELYDFPDGTTPTEMLMSALPQGIDAACTVVMVNTTQTVIGESECLFKPCFDGDIVTVINEPKFLGFTAGQIIYALVVVAAVAYSLSVRPSIPGNMGNVKDSPNNTLQGQTNRTRSYQAYPDVFGSPVCYPDLGGEAITEYVDNKKIVRQFMCIGNGSYDVPPLNAGSTPLTNFDGATQEVIEPVSTTQTFTTNIVANTSQSYQLENVLQGFIDFAAGSQIRITNLVVAPAVSGDDIRLDGLYTVVSIDVVDIGGTLYSRMTLLEPEKVNAGWTELAARGGEGDSIITGFTPVFSSDSEAITDVTYSFDVNEVDGQEIPARNQGGDGTSATTAALVTDISFIGNQFTYSTLSTTEWDTLKAEFDAAVDEYYVAVDYEYGLTIPGAGVTDQLIETTGYGTLTSMTLVSDIGGDYYDIVIDDFVGTGEQGGVPPYGQDVTMTNTTGVTLGPFQTPLECDELWLNMIYQRGLKGANFYKVHTNQVEADGTVIPGTYQVFEFNHSASTFDQQFRTNKLIPISGRGYYSLEIRRVDISPNSSEAPDAAQFENLAAILNDKERNFGNVTLLKIQVPATINATSLRENKINGRITRKVITYNTTTGLVDYNLTPSLRFADALLHEFVIVFGRSPDDLDLDGLYEIQERLDAINPELGQFEYTFDDLDIGLGERMDAILTVARCFKYLDGNVYRFGREEAQEFDSNVITQRDIAAPAQRNYSGQYISSMPSDYDSVKIDYVDPDTNKKASIYRSIRDGVIISVRGQRPKKLELSGCRNVAQATDRAEIEIRKIIYQRFVVKDTLLSQGALIDKGQTVKYAEQFNSETSDGEIMSVVGDIAYTSNSIEWTDGATHFVEFKDEFNNLHRSEVEEVAGNEKAFRILDAGVIGNIYLPTGNEQLGSVYIIGVAEEIEASRWVVTEKTASSGGNVELTMTNYDERIYEMDAT